ncbi:MAG: hypothetical protein ACLUZZ_04150 [Alistipes inops]
MSEISRLEPRAVWEIFDEITQVPRPSKKEEKIIAYLERFARKHSLDYRKDTAGNIVMYKKATPSMAGKPTVVLQSHMDMVCEKNADVAFDFMTDPIQPYIDGEWVKARGTTLGADDGIGMATALALITAEGVTSRPRSVIHGGRGDGPYRCVQPRQRHALGPLPHQPRLGRRRRDFHRLRRRRRYGSDFPLPRRTRPGRDDLDAGRHLRSQRRPFGRQHQRRTRQLQQAAHAPAAGRNGTYGPASGLVRRG